MQPRRQRAMGPTRPGNCLERGWLVTHGLIAIDSSESRKTHPGRRA